MSRGISRPIRPGRRGKIRDNISNTEARAYRDRTRQKGVDCGMQASRIRAASRNGGAPARAGTAPTGVVTGLLRAWGRGDTEAREKLIPVVYAELRRRAAAYLRRERQDHTLQPTALVHEAYLRLVGQDRVVWQNRAQFFGIAAQMMRRILVDHARGHRRGKRGGDATRVTLDERLGAAKPPDCTVLMLDRALEQLAAIDPQQSRIVELRYFGGLTEAEVAEVLDVSRSTVTREWHTAKAWLYRSIRTGREGSPA
jgi:RNA polymerase sigma factor (TIGR02999 family)